MVRPADECEASPVRCSNADSYDAGHREAHKTQILSGEAPSVIMDNGSSNCSFWRFSDIRSGAVSVLVCGTLPQSCRPRGATEARSRLGGSNLGSNPSGGIFLHARILRRLHGCDSDALRLSHVHTHDATMEDALLASTCTSRCRATCAQLSSRLVSALEM